MGFRHAAKYQLSKHVFGQAYHFAMQYKEWKTEHYRITHNTNNYDPVIDSRRLFLESIEDTCRESDKFIWMYILKGVTEENTTYQRLRARGMPCGRNYYYDRRRRFYWLLSRKIG